MDGIAYISALYISTDKQSLEFVFQEYFINEKLERVENKLKFGRFISFEEFSEKVSVLTFQNNLEPLLERAKPEIEYLNYNFDEIVSRFIKEYSERKE